VEAYYGIGKITIHEKDAKFGENRKIFFFAGFAQPEADPSQPKADPSSGGLWRSLGEGGNLAEVGLLHTQREELTRGEKRSQIFQDDFGVGSCTMVNISHDPRSIHQSS